MGNENLESEESALGNIRPLEKKINCRENSYALITRRK